MIIDKVLSEKNAMSIESIVTITIKHLQTNQILTLSNLWVVDMLYQINWTARGVMVIVVGNGHGDTSSD